MDFERGPYNHQDENCIWSSDGIMILEDGLSIGFGDKDIWDPTQIQMQITARVIANSVASAIAAVALRHLLWEDLNCQKKKCLRVFRNLYYKHLHCPIRICYSHLWDIHRRRIAIWHYRRWVYRQYSQNPDTTPWRTGHCQPWEDLIRTRWGGTLYRVPVRPSLMKSVYRG